MTAENNPDESPPVFGLDSEFLKVVTDRLPVRVGYIDREYRYQFLNGEYERQFGFASGEGRGKTVEELDGAEAAKIGIPHLRRALNGESHTQEFRVPYPFGERWVVANYVSDIDEHGEVRGVIVHVLDVTDRYLAERALEDERKDTVRSLDAAEVATWIVDLKKDLVFASPKLREWYGISESLPTWSPIDRYVAAVHPEDRELVVQRLQDSARPDGKFEVEYRVRGTDGLERWVLARGSTSTDADGVPQRLSGAVIDITRRKRVEAKNQFLFRLDDALRPLTDPEQLTLTAATLLGKHLNVDRCAYADIEEDQDTMNLAGNYLRNPEIKSIVGRLKFRNFGEEVLALMRSDEPYVVEDVDTHQPPVGDPFAYRATQIQAVICVPLHKCGKFVAAMAVHTTTPRRWIPDEVDLVRTVASRCWESIERARVERDLRQSEQRFRQLVELSPSTVWFGEVDGDLSYISQDFYDYTGLTSETALSTGWTTAIHPEDLPRVLEAWQSARSAGTRLDTEVRVRGHNGDFRWMSVRALPMRDDQGEIQGWLGSNNDIEERKSAERTLQARVDERTQELQATVREAEGFNYSISHDLRSPLRAISSTAHILVEEASDRLDEYHRELLRRQADSAQRLGRLIDELLRLSRLARVEVNRQPLDMTAKAHSVIEELGEAVGDCHFEVQEGMASVGDPGLVRTVLHNLIGNACKFSPEGGTVRIRQEGPVFSVSDEGVGFDMAFAAKIFLPFERLVNDSQFPGTGIGLANVDRIVKRHDGRVWVESQAGSGTTFSFTLEPQA